jgi:hypothetical protein
MEKTRNDKRDEGAELVRLSLEYCKLLDRIDKLPLHEFLDRVSSLLMSIYRQTFEVTRFQTRYESEPQKFLTEKQYNKVRETVKYIFDKRDSYTEIIDPAKPSNTRSFQASLSEDLTDIYQDFYDFVNWYSVGTFESVNDSLVECLSSFEKYWGIKLLGVLRAIHIVRYTKKDGTIFRDPLNDEEDDIPDKEDDQIIDTEALNDFLKEEL